MRSAPHPNCIVCGSVGRSVYRDLNDRMFSAPGKWSIDRCSNTACGTLWLDPAPVPEDLGEAYRGYFTHVAKTNPRLSSLKRAYLTTRYAENGARGIMDRLGAAVFALRFRRRMEADDQAAHTRKPKGKAVFLDIGCGSGDAMWLLSELGWETIGVEFDAEAVAAARSRGLTVHEGDLLDQKLETGSFDAVQLSHVIEHLPDPVATLKECHRILKPGGSVVIDVPQTWHYYTLGKMALIAIDKWFAGWETQFTPGQLEALARQAGGVVDRTYGDWMVPGLWYRALRKILLTRLGWKLPMFPEPVPPLARLGEKWRAWFGTRRLSLYTTPTIGVIARKPEA